jgi:hypothetical protein
VSTMTDLVRDGWQAPAPVLIRSILVALAISTPVAIGLALLTPLSAGLLTIVVGLVQLGGTLAVAGREMQRQGGR